MARRSSVIRVSILGDASQLTQAFDEAERRSQSLEQRLSSTGASLTRNVTLPLLAVGAAAFKLAGDQEKAEAKLNAVIKSTGGVAGVTAGHVKELAASLQQVTTFGDETTIAGANLLLTFKNLRNEVGQGNDIFDRTTKVMLDMSTALDQDLKSSAIQLGKALNDPIAGMAALTRVGITFTDSQKEQIKTLQESGDLLGAQKVILQELESQFQGTAAAVAQTSTGQIKQALNALGDAGESIGTIVAPAVVEVAKAVKSAAESFQELPKGVQENIVKLGLLVTVAAPVLTVLGKMILLYKQLRLAALGAAAAQAASAAGGVAGGAGAAAGAGGGLLRGGAAGAGAGAAARAGLGLPLAVLAGAVVADQTLLSGDVERTNAVFAEMERKGKRLAASTGRLSPEIENLTSEQRAAAGAALELSTAATQAAQRAFFMKEHLDGAGGAAQGAKKPLSDLAGAASAAAANLGLLGSGQDAFNRLSSLLEEGKVLRSVGLEGFSSVDEVLRAKAGLESQGFDTGRLGRGDTFNFDVTVTTPQTAESFTRDMEREARRRRAEVVNTGAN